MEEVKKVIQGEPIRNIHDVISEDLSRIGAKAPEPGASSEGWDKQNDSPVLVHFGDSDFESKYETLMEKMTQWRATTGTIESVDLRFNGEAVVNSDTPAIAKQVEKVSPARKRPVSAANTNRHSR